MIVALLQASQGSDNILYSPSLFCSLITAAELLSDLILSQSGSCVIHSSIVSRRVQKHGCARYKIVLMSVFEFKIIKCLHLTAVTEKAPILVYLNFKKKKDWIVVREWKGKELHTLDEGKLN